MDGAKLGPALRSFLVAAVTLVVSACSKTPVDVQGSQPLTRDEAYALAGQLGLESFGFAQQEGTASTTASPVGLPLAAETVSVGYSFTRPCFLGGSVASSGKVSVQRDQATDLSIVDIQATDVHHACTFLAGTTRVAITGDPDVTTTVHVATLQGEPMGTQSVSVQGGFKYVTDDGRKGRCPLDIQVEVDADHATQTTRGNLCGFTYDVTVASG